MLACASIMTALDAGVPLRDVQIGARHADFPLKGCSVQIQVAFMA